eukprot:122414_1
MLPFVLVLHYLVYYFTVTYGSSTCPAVSRLKYGSGPIYNITLLHLARHSLQLSITLTITIYEPSPKSHTNNSHGLPLTSCESDASNVDFNIIKNICFYNENAYKHHLINLFSSSSSVLFFLYLN